MNPILSLLASAQYLRQFLVQGGLKLINGHFYAISYVTSVTGNHACSQTLQWTPETNMQVYDLLLSTTQNAKPEEMIAYWKQVL